MDGSSLEEIDPVRTFVQNALLAKEHGNSFQYDVVVTQMRRREDPETIARVVMVMENFSAYLSNRSDLFHELLHAVFGYDWRGDDRLNMAMMDLIIAIISCNVTFAKLAYRGFVHTFFQPELAQKVPDDEEARKQRFDIIHDGIRSISSQVPMSTSSLFDELRSNFPHKRFAHRVQAEYLQHCLRICDTIPRIRDKLLDLIVTKCLEIDVEIIIDEAGEVHVQRETSVSAITVDPKNTAISEERLTSPESNGDDLSHNPPYLLTSLEEEVAPPVTTVVSSGEESKRKQAVQESANKLDAMLTLIVDYIASQAPSSVTSASSSSNKSSKKPHVARSTSHYLEFWPILLKIFEKRLLITHKSKFVQFIFFYATTALQPKIFAESFCRRLLVIAFDLSAPVTVRLSATMYLASFLARANVFALSLVRDLVREILEWCVMYVLVYRADPHYPSHMTPTHADPVQSLTTLMKKRLKKKFATLRDHAKEMLVNAQQYQQQQSIRQQQQKQSSSASVTSAQNSRASSRMSDGSSVVSGLSSLSPHNNNMHNANNNNNNNNSSGMMMELDEYGRLQVKESSIRQHAVFYALTQALAYVLCFYGTELVDLFVPPTSADSSSSSCNNGDHTAAGVAAGAKKRKHSDDSDFHSVAEESQAQQQEEDERHVGFLPALEIIYGSRFDPLRYVMTSVRYEFFRLVIHRNLFAREMWLCQLSPESMAFDNDLPTVKAEDEDGNEEDDNHDEQNSDVDAEVEDEDEEGDGTSRSDAKKRNRKKTRHNSAEIYRRRQEEERNKIMNNSILQYYYNIQREEEERLSASSFQQDEDSAGHRNSHIQNNKSLDDDDMRSVVSGLSAGSRFSVFSSTSMLSTGSRNSVSTMAYAQSVWSAPDNYHDEDNNHNYSSSNNQSSNNNNSSSYHYHQQQQYKELMENFFPFDPCLLCELHAKLTPYYRDWQGVPGVPAVQSTSSRRSSIVSNNESDMYHAEEGEEEREEEEGSDIEEDDDGKVLGSDEDITVNTSDEEEEEEEEEDNNGTSEEEETIENAVHVKNNKNLVSGDNNSKQKQHIAATVVDVASPASSAAAMSIVMSPPYNNNNNNNNNNKHMKNSTVNNNNSNNSNKGKAISANTATTLLYGQNTTSTISSNGHGNANKAKTKSSSSSKCETSPSNTSQQSDHSLISRMDPTHPLLAGGFFFPANYTIATDVHKDTNEEEEPLKKKKKKDRKEAMEVPVIMSSAVHPSGNEKLAEAAEEEEVQEETEEMMAKRLKKEAKKAKKEKKREKKEKKKLQKQQLLVKPDENNNSSSEGEEDNNDGDDNRDDNNEVRLTLSSLKQLSSTTGTTSAVTMNTNPVVDRFLREQNHANVINSSTKKHKTQNFDVFTFPASTSSSSAMGTTTPYKSPHAYPKSSDTRKQKNANYEYDDLPQPDLSPLQRQQYQPASHTKSSSASEQKRQKHGQKHSKTTTPTHHHHPHHMMMQCDDQDEDNTSEYQGEYQAQHDPAYHDQNLGGQVQRSEVGGGEMDEDMMMTSRPRQYSITSTGSW